MTRRIFYADGVKKMKRTFESFDRQKNDHLTHGLQKKTFFLSKEVIRATFQ